MTKAPTRFQSGLFSKEDSLFGLHLGSEDTRLGVLMELEVGHGEAEVYARFQA